MSSYLNISAIGPAEPPNRRWRGAARDILVDVKQSHNLRDVRDALLSLAYALDTEPLSTDAVCLIAHSKVSRLRLKTELDLARKVLRDPIAGRLHLHALDAEGAFLPPLETRDQGFSEWLRGLVGAERGVGRSRRANRQTVVSALVMSWLRGEGPQTLKALQEACSASYPTVASAVGEMRTQGLLVERSDRKLLLHEHLPLQAWTQIGEAHVDLRKVTRFFDPSGQSRGPEGLANRLFALQRKGQLQQVAIGGVLGAMHYFPDLDITASPRFDLSVYGDADLSFVRQLDAALVPTDDPRAKAALVIHATPEPVRFIEREEAASGLQVWASELECLADLLEMGFKAEVAGMVVDFNQRRINGKRRERWPLGHAGQGDER